MADPSPPAPASRFDGRLRASLRMVLWAAGALTLFAFALVDVRAGISVAVGGALAAGNLWVLARIVTELLPTDRAGADAQSRGGWALVAVLKILGLLAAAWLLMRHAQAIVAPLPMLVGFAALPIGIAIGSLVSDRSAPGESSTGAPPR